MTDSALRTHYDTLQVARTASDEVIRGAYRYLSQKYHPDKHPEDRLDAEHTMKMINEAYEVLSDPEKRRAHDEWIAREEAARGRASRAGAEQASQESASARSSLSSEVRGEYVRSIARGGVVWYIALGIVVGLLNVGFWSLIPPVARFLDRHGWAPLLLFVVTLWTCAWEAYNKRRNTLSSYPDDRLQVAYDTSSRRRMVAIIAGSILSVGAAIVVVLLVRKNELAVSADQPSPVASEVQTPAETVAANAAADTPPPPAEPQIQTLDDNPTVVTKGDAYQFPFKISQKMKVRIVVAVDGDMPVDVVTIPDTSKSEYMEIASNVQIGDAVQEVGWAAELLGANTDQDKKEAAERQAAIDGMFNTGISKRGVYRLYESSWIELHEGTYSVFIDNTDAFTPAREDAPVHIQVQAQRVLP